MSPFRNIPNCYGPFSSMGNALKRPISKGEIRGRGKRIKGKTREKVGRLTKRRSSQLKGMFEQTEGMFVEGTARLERKIKNLF